MCQRRIGVMSVQHTPYVGVQDMTCGRLRELNYTVWSPFLAAEISTWPDHPGLAADTTQPEELFGTWADGKMVRIKTSFKINLNQRVCKSDMNVLTGQAITKIQNC